MIHVESITGVIFDEERKKVLLIQRRDVPVWVLPGGGIEPHETPENAVIREILEETGLRVKASRLVGTYFPINRLAKITELYECIPIGGTLALSKETKNVAFFSLQQLPSLIPPPYREWIEDAKTICSPIQKNLTSVTYKTLFFSLLKHPVLVLRFLLARLGYAINT